MAHKPYTELPDGTRVYSNGMRYKPLSPEQRKNKVNRPDDPRAVRFHTRWYLPLNVLPDGERVMPVTQPDLSRDRPKYARSADFTP